MTKQQQLDEITREIEACAECKIGKTGVAVPGEGNPNADIVFLGEAPGKQEAKNGRPFIGRSGQLLRGLIRESGLTEEDVYITSPVKYLPLRGTPTKADIAHGRIHLFKQLAVIQPRYIVLLGSVAAQAMLGKVLPITKEHGHVFHEDGRTYFLTFHPAAGLRFPPVKKELVKDFADLKTLLGSAT